MKKILLQFAALFVLIGALLLIGGRTEGWIEPPEEEASSDIILAGQKWGGKVVVNVTLHPDGTGEHEGNGEKTPCEWEAGTGDVAMVVHLHVKGNDYDMNVIDTGAGYVADYPLVGDFQLTGSKPVKDIILAGQKWGGKVVVNVTLHPDGTGEHEGNGEKTPCEWEAGTGDVAMVVHLHVKGNDYDMNVIDTGAGYVADYPLVGDFQLTGSKSGSMAAAETAEEAPAEETASAAEADSQPAAESAEQAETKSTEAVNEEPSYPANTFVLPFTADISEQLQTTFFSEPSVWGTALGTSGSYTPSDSKDILFSWSNNGKSNELDFLADGTYEYRFTKMSITEHGTWAFDDWHLTLTTEAGREMPAELVKGEEAPAEEAVSAAEADSQPVAESAEQAETKSTEAVNEEPSYPANTFVLPFTADISEQLQTTFFSESSVWGTALGTSGSYTPSDSKDILFSWSNNGKSNELDFLADGTYEYRFTKMSITEHGTWAFDDWHLTLTTEAGREMPAELVK